MWFPVRTLAALLVFSLFSRWSAPANFECDSSLGRHVLKAVVS